MFVKSIRFPFVFFVVSIVWQLITNEKVNWIDNIGICFIMFLILLFYNWSKTPHKWKKENA